MSTTPRVSSAVAGEPPHFGSVLAHQPELAARFFALYGRFWDSDILPARIKEVARMRNARITECGFCRQVRFDKALGQGLGEDVVDDITDGYETSSRLTDAEKAALKFTDALIHDPALLDGDAQAALRRHFTPGQIAELGLGVTLFLALAKALITMGLEPEAMERTVLPTPRLAELAA
ncbi:MAG: carboxymuconolactone decarboxylase family protein [Erythrobacter sp.]